MQTSHANGIRNDESSLENNGQLAQRILGKKCLIEYYFIGQLQWTNTIIVIVQSHIVAQLVDQTINYIDLVLNGQKSYYPGHLRTDNIYVSTYLLHNIRDTRKRWLKRSAWNTMQNDLPSGFVPHHRSVGFISDTRLVWRQNADSVISRGVSENSVQSEDQLVLRHYYLLSWTEI